MREEIDPAREELHLREPRESLDALLERSLSALADDDEGSACTVGRGGQEAAASISENQTANDRLIKRILIERRRVSITG